ncbi:hypothetical protein FZ983_32350 [Azospirillum sp. B21]|uniref:hypothetical protein n=1 Tax=Azospirillum sp. B21 TaxID=2607496 RepID=UPI0011ED5099|nr:hypothetical protein [Azospirillum sp. B21]KAA0572264.1 hypothetical protein FZ983_32350 [Azospirillum sp. B21]
MPVLRLRADDEAALIEALPMLRGADEAGAPCWLTAGPVCDLDPIGPLALTAPVTDPETGEVTEPAVVDERWHANLRGPRIGADPVEWEAIVAAAEPYTLSEVNNPRRRFML